MDKFLKNYIGIAILIIVFVIFMVISKFNPAFLGNISFINKGSNTYKQACANYISNFLNVNYHKKTTFTKTGIDSAAISRIQIDTKARSNLGDKNNKINVIVVTNLKANIDNDLSYKITCWINSNFKEDPESITSYDILKIDISKAGDKSAFKILEENY